MAEDHIQAISAWRTLTQFPRGGCVLYSKTCVNNGIPYNSSVARRMIRRSRCFQNRENAWLHQRHRHERILRVFHRHYILRYCWMGLGEPQSTFDVLECRFVQGKEKATISADRASKRAIKTTPHFRIQNVLADQNGMTTDPTIWRTMTATASLLGVCDRTIRRRYDE